MPFVLPTVPNTAPKTSPRVDAVALSKSGNLAALSVPPPFLAGETDDKAVTPAAPPSAVQMQIKELINEQAQALRLKSEESGEQSR